MDPGHPVTANHRHHVEGSRYAASFLGGYSTNEKAALGGCSTNRTSPRQLISQGRAPPDR